MGKYATSVKKNKENKINVAVGSLFLIAIVGAVTLGIIFPITIPYCLEILRWSALLLLAAIAWRDVFNAIEITESKQHHYQHSL